MEKTPRQEQAEIDYDKRLDALVDQGSSYDDARRKLGEPPYATVETFVIPTQVEPTKAALGRRAVSGRSHYHPSRGPRGEEEGVGYPNGEPPYYQSLDDAVLSDDQVKINTEGLRKVREALADAKASKEKQD